MSLLYVALFHLTTSYTRAYTGNLRVDDYQKTALACYRAPEFCGRRIGNSTVASQSAIVAHGSYYSPIAWTNSIPRRSFQLARSIRHCASKFAQVLLRRCTMTSSERRVTSGEVRNKEDDGGEAGETGTGQGRRRARSRLIPSPVPRRQFVLDLVRRDRLFPFAREREVKPGSPSPPPLSLSFFHRGTNPLAADPSLVSSRTKVDCRGIAGSTGETRPASRRANLRGGIARLTLDTAVINHPTVSRSAVTVPLKTVASSSRSG